jgi:integrase
MAFRNFTGRPIWAWTTHDMDRYGSLLHARYAPGTTVHIQGSIRRFCDYARDAGNPYDEQCYALTGRRIPQVCTRKNTVRGNRTTSKRRQFTPSELDRLFTTVRARIGAADSRRRWLARCTHYAAAHALLAFGARDVEIRMADQSDLHPVVTPELASFSAFEDLLIRFGKSHDGGGWKVRTVIVSFVFRESLDVLKWYLDDIRPQIETQPGAQDALFPTINGDRFGETAISTWFKQYVRLAGLSEDLTSHCLRHTYETMLHEAGLDIPVISKQMGHGSEATTLLYDHMGEDFLKEHILDFHREAIARASGERAHAGR